jgi:hypothetical protein
MRDEDNSANDGLLVMNEATLRRFENMSPVVREMRRDISEIENAQREMELELARERNARRQLQTTVEEIQQILFFNPVSPFNDRIAELMLQQEQRSRPFKSRPL